ncbi:MAG: diguanylate cyclase [Halanaerobium sp.]
MKYDNYSKKELIKLLEIKQKINENVPIGYCITNQEGYFEEVNKEYCKIYGYQEDELLGEHFSLVTTEENTEELMELHDQFLAQGIELKEEWQVKTKAGKKIYIKAHAAIIKGRDNEQKKVTYITDITKIKKIEAKLKKLNEKLKEKAIKDELTSLYNYGEIMNRLEKEINRCSHINSSLSIMMIDIDDFSEVNNNYGHVKGDRVIKTAAARIKESIRKMDLAGRYGGDEFLIVFPDTDIEKAEVVADRILENVRSKKIEGINISFSAGISEFEGQNADQFVAVADKLLYKVKKADKNGIITDK